MQSSPTYKLSNNLPTNSNMATGTTTASPNEDAHNESHEKPQRSFFGLIERPQHGCHPVIDWLTTVDHKKIGIMYGAAALIFLLIGGFEALMIRAQLFMPQNDVVSARLYNQLFTMHGTTMIFLAVMPLNAAFFNYLMILQIGARDVAFPRLNSFSLWSFVAGAVLINLSWFWEAFHGGWFGYAPLSGRLYTPVGSRLLDTESSNSRGRIARGLV